MATPVVTNVINVVDDGGSFMRPIIASIILGIGATIMLFGLQLKEISKNWDKYRCQPQYMATASLFGKDTNENFNFCTQKVFKDQVPGVVGPMYKIMAQGTGVMSTILDTANSLRLGLATLVGGITNIVQDFTSRLTQFFFAIRTQVQRMRSMMFRVYGTMFAMFYMVFSGITAAQNFFDSGIGKFLSFIACFPPSTPIDLADGRQVAISDIKIGDVMTGGHVCTGTFRFYADGTDMVRIGTLIVSSTHYVLHEGKWIMAGEHPDAVSHGKWSGGTQEPLICLNTNTHQMIIGGLTLRDYDETEEGDEATERFVERSLNGGDEGGAERPWSDYGPLLHPTTKIRLADGRQLAAADLQLGDKVEGGGQVHGIMRKRTDETTKYNIHPSSPIYVNNEWVRAGRITPTIKLEVPEEYVGAFIYPHSYMITNSGLAVRDYMEVCNPGTESAYSAALGHTCLVGAQ
jgi:hypothetical protein